MAKKIQLTKGYFTIVDDADYDLVSKFKWCISSGKTVKYARRGTLKIEKEKFRCAQIAMHRFILGITNPKIEVDHKDGDGLNNQRYNLRTANRFEQTRNVPKWSTVTGSKFKGVTYHNRSQMWASRIHINGYGFWIGTFESEREAAVAYDVLATAHFGEFARTNFKSVSGREISNVVRRISFPKTKGRRIVNQKWIEMKESILDKISQLRQ